MKTLVIVNAGLGDPSTTRQVAEQIADATVRQVTAAGEGLDVRVVDVRALAADLATYMTTFIATPALEDARRTVTDADALIAATPVFQGSYSGLFKMFFDALDMKSLAGIPVTMVATAGTARHSMVLDFAVRPLLSFLHAVVLPTGVFVDTAEFGADSALPRRVATAAGELAEQLTSVVSGVAGFTGSTETREPAEGDATAGEGVDGAAPEDADFHVPAGGFAALLAGHSGE
ncbi:MAG: NAD(P)H-dependent oxidoreductase [Corynebacterium variabile]|uniref:CE1759 family FMN reductase n=1 Tax=Corynebacterium variabile TaxID=1727 RepID=UPI002649854B|nr:CE1759 family FMN reductase [Corynebacterium variabile]MDN6438387.1 NAD(P)H-dependent oxidoreductase [Corynebacterium nuruki]MDN6240455.1 NAD(P)H-dependent oxidoreductase [Corynebacterium variabile]MDN6536114.1 NAD(P)H-dependent oxidoreductase [Corynebacterium variabile]MDN6676167.1 NAD(P)H-dependent oxidoreductase [Corynebacterium variabile]MDN6813122.1 NAD(P)H-dependent oxidoreductase [Corynebacterium variabile]